METASDTEREGLEHLVRIEGELEEIKEHTGGTWRSFFSGLLQGSGAVVGGVLAVAVIGWTLAALGIIPGLGAISAHLNAAFAQLHPSR